jgi:hypothetical protein
MFCCKLGILDDPAAKNPPIYFDPEHGVARSKEDSHYGKIRQICIRPFRPACIILSLNSYHSFWLWRAVTPDDY